MQNLQITHGFVRKLTKNIRDAYGKEVPHTKTMELVADALGWQAGPLMHALKQADSPDNATATAPAAWFSRKEVPDLDGLGSLSQSAMEGLREIGRHKTGLVLITGVTGSGKSFTANSLLRQWARDTGRLGITAGEIIEQVIGGKHGDGMIVQNRTHRRELFREVLPMLRTYDPAFILFEDHLYGEDDLRNNFLDAIQAASDRVVIVSASGVSSATIIGAMALGLSRVSPHSLEEATRFFTNSISASIDVALEWGERGHPPKFKADVKFHERAL
ncbi:GspE family protein [Pararhizobium sp. BT-229]|uniref:GspE family protein n=1 Tax=Pararhizobium sp. BT-229 TaxID=2986923 RepID=UPI0021F7E459|nr:GspE family protein [Pararhizobium sp. BT-229]MCV9964284.1 GspE family protein [Pararhizobium sp. BT-229]